MLRSVVTVAAALVLLAVGAMTATAGNRPAQSSGQLAAAAKAGSITTLMTGATLVVKAQDDEEKAQEAAQAQAQAAAAAQAQVQAQAENDSETADDATDAKDTEVTDEVAPAAAPATNTEPQGAEHDD